jgi:hypothetical protein
MIKSRTSSSATTNSTAFSSDSNSDDNNSAIFYESEEDSELGLPVINDCDNIQTHIHNELQSNNTATKQKCKLCVIKRKTQGTPYDKCYEFNGKNGKGYVFYPKLPEKKGIISKISKLVRPQNDYCVLHEGATNDNCTKISLENEGGKSKKRKTKSKKRKTKSKKRKTKSKKRKTKSKKLSG